MLTFACSKSESASTNGPLGKVRLQNPPARSVERIVYEYVVVLVVKATAVGAASVAGVSYVVLVVPVLVLVVPGLDPLGHEAME
jgi:hypothetical protein